MEPSFLLDESEKYTKAGHLTIPISSDIVKGKKPRSRQEVQVPGRTMGVFMTEHTEKDGLPTTTMKWNIWQ